MSVEATMWALDAPTTNATEKAILLVLANYVGVDGTCYPGQDTIAAKATCSVKSVERILAAFESRGWIKRYARRRRDGSRTSDLIEFTVAEAPERNGNTQPDTVSGSADQPDTVSEPTRHPVQTNPTPCPNQPDTVSGLTSFEQLGEQEGEDADVTRDAEPTPVEDWPAGKSLEHARALIAEAATPNLNLERTPQLLTTITLLSRWRKAGASWEHDVVPVVTGLARKSRTPITSWKFFDAAVAQAIADNRQALTLPEARNARPAHVPSADQRVVARRENRDRSGAGAERAVDVMAARRAL
ncbi:helix-turn-helix domain-containing protein [Brevundimonas sp.]